MAKSQRIYSAKEYLELITGCSYVISGNDDIAFIENVLKAEDFCLWNYPLDEINHIVDENLDVVLVDCMVFNKKAGGFEHEYRWFEIYDRKGSEKTDMLKQIAINAIEHSIFCDSEILTEYYGSANEYFEKNFGCTVDEAEKALDCKFGIRDRWPEESIWSEIRADHIDDFERKTCVDAWVSDDDWEEGKVIAKIDTNGNIEYLDERAKTDSYAQEVIANAIAEIKKAREKDNGKEKV